MSVRAPGDTRRRADPVFSAAPVAERVPVQNPTPHLLGKQPKAAPLILAPLIPGQSWPLFNERS